MIKTECFIFPFKQSPPPMYSLESGITSLLASLSDFFLTHQEFLLAQLGAISEDVANSMSPALLSLVLQFELCISVVFVPVGPIPFVALCFNSFFVWEEILSQH